jgi:hypothetical protein
MQPLELKPGMILLLYAALKRRSSTLLKARQRRGYGVAVEVEGYCAV